MRGAGDSGGLRPASERRCAALGRARRGRRGLGDESPHSSADRHLRTAVDRRARGRAALAVGLAAATVLAGCGQPDFTRRPPRPPATVQITGVITPQEVEVSPDRVGAGPVILIVSNQSSASHTVVLEGERLREQVGPINPQDTATIQANLQQGTYTVRAGSERAVSPGQQIRPAMLSAGRERPTGEDELLRP